MFSLDTLGDRRGKSERRPLTVGKSPKMIALARLHFSEGDVYRLLPLPNIKKGKWYISIQCRGCRKPVYLLEDPDKGRVKGRIVGKGYISTACRRCGTDEKYATHELTSVRAKKTINLKILRVEPSNMPRQPITKKYSKVNPTFGPGFLEDRPKAAAIVVRCIALWTEVETEEAHLLATMLRANTEPAIALFLTLQNSRLQFAVLDEVAKVVLNEADYDLFSALMTYSASVEKERNALAHGCFGGSDQIKEGVAWINQVHRTQHTVRVTATGITDEAMLWVRERTYVYELGDLETIARDIENVQRQLSFFRGYLVSRHTDPPAPDAWRAERYLQPCAEPRIAQLLSQLREGRKKMSPAPS